MAAVAKLVGQVAEALASATAPQPEIVVPPALKLIVPVGVAPVTMAVKVTAFPARLGLTLLLTVVLELLGDAGVTRFEAAEAGPGPATLLAVTVHVTATPPVRPFTTIGEATPVLLWLLQVAV